jgi:hypothetical protein
MSELMELWRNNRGYLILSIIGALSLIWYLVTFGVN